mgnify:CR=1 FL=1
MSSRYCARTARRGSARLRFAAAIVVALALLLLPLLLLALPSPGALAQPPFIEEMSTDEVQSYLARGGTTAIISFGSTEQNGPHMILGKHDYIVSHTAGRIAKEP